MSYGAPATWVPPAGGGGLACTEFDAALMERRVGVASQRAIPSAARPPLPQPRERGQGVRVRPGRDIAASLTVGSRIVGREGRGGPQSAIVNRELGRMGGVGVAWGRAGCGVGVPLPGLSGGGAPRLRGWGVGPGLNRESRMAAEEVPIPARQSRSDWRAHWQGGSEGTGELAGRYLASRQILKQLCRQLEPPVGSYGSDSWHRCSSLAARAARAMVGLNDLKPSPEAPAVSLYQYLSPVRRGQHA